MALSKNRIKYIHSLELKKNRKTEKVFLAEGPKLDIFPAAFWQLRPNGYRNIPSFR